MTDSSSLELANITSEFCICSICRSTLNQPRILECFHTFCYGCLEQYIPQQISGKEVRTFPCPACGKLAAVQQIAGTKSCADGLKSDTFSAKLLEVLSAFKDDKNCDICQRRDTHVVATGWCMDCYDALCQDCTKIHLYGKVTCDHVVMTLTELHKLSLENVMRRTTSQSCTRHPEELVKLYCLDCQEPVCVQCLAFSHRKCENCVPTSEARKTVQDDVTNILSRLSMLTIEDGAKATTFQNGINGLEECVEKTEAEIRSTAEDLRHKITVYEEALIEKLHSMSSQLRDKSNDTQAEAKSPTNGIKSLLSAQNRMIGILKYGGDLDILDIYHSVKDMLSKTDDEDLTSHDKVQFKMNFDLDETVKNFCRDFKRLGEIRVEDCGCDEGLSSWGVAVTMRDDIVVTDARNRRVQKFTSTGALVDHIQLNEEPRDISSCGESDVAITILKKEIFIVTATGNLELKKRFKTQRQYDGIAFYAAGRCFLVSSLEEKCIAIITTFGAEIKTFNVNGSTLQPIFNEPRYVAFTKEGHYLVSDTGQSSVMYISQDGALLFSYAPNNGSHALKKAQGVCCEKTGNIFVADYANSRIHLLTPDGTFQRLLQKERFVLGRDAGLRRPVALTMTHSNKLVVIQSDGMVKVFSYEGMEAERRSSFWRPRNTTSVSGVAEQAGGPSYPNHEGSGEGHEIPKSQTGQDRLRSYSTTSPSMRKLDAKYRRFSETTQPETSNSSLAPHTFRSRHF